MNSRFYLNNTSYVQNQTRSDIAKTYPGFPILQSTINVDRNIQNTNIFGSNQGSAVYKIKNDTQNNVLKDNEKDDINGELTPLKKE